MKKEEVSRRVLKDGNPLSLDLFNWDENTGTFSSVEDNLVIDFDTGSDCTFDTGSHCTFKTGSHCTFKTEYNCTFKTESHCTFDTGSHCTFKTGSDCTFDTGYNCTFDTGSHCVIVRRDLFEVIILKENQNNIKLCPYNIKGYLKENKLFIDNIEQVGNYIIADNILSKIISKKGNVYKVKNYKQDKETFLIIQDGISSHGNTLKEAKESLIYKISSKDTSKYKDYNLETILTKKESIKMYRVITGACEAGTRYFIENLKEVKENYTIKEIIEITKGQYGNENLKKFFKLG